MYEFVLQAPTIERKTDLRVLYEYLRYYLMYGQQTWLGQIMTLIMQAAS